MGWQWLVNNWAMIASVSLGISEAMSLIPGIGANGIVQFVVMALKWLVARAEPSPGPIDPNDPQYAPPKGWQPPPPAP